MKKRAPDRFEVGDTVRWWSQANGGGTTKKGKIVVIVPPGCRVYDVLADTIGTEKYRMQAIDTRSMARKDESYVVEVAVPSKTGKAKPRLYWPLVSALERVGS